MGLYFVGLGCKLKHSDGVNEIDAKIYVVGWPPVVMRAPQRHY